MRFIFIILLFISVSTYAAGICPPEGCEKKIWTLSELIFDGNAPWGHIFSPWIAASSLVLLLSHVRSKYTGGHRRKKHA